MDETRLKMNLSKTEFIYFGNARQLLKYDITSINIAGDLILRTDIIRYLGVWLNSTLNFKTHITKIAKHPCLTSLGLGVSVTFSPRMLLQA